MFFYVSKIIWLLIQPLNFAALLVLAACVAAWRSRTRAAKLLITGAALLLFLPMIFPVERVLLLPLESRFPAPKPWPHQVDGILLLGGAQRPLMTAAHGEPELNDGAETLTTFLALGRHYPDAKLVFSGGTGNLLHQGLSEADTVRLFLRQQGFDENRVIYERKSRNTYENAVFSKALVQPTAGERWLVVGNARTMPRIMGIFRKVEWPVIPMPCDHLVAPTAGGWFKLNVLDTFEDLTSGLYEWVGLLAYYATGKTAEFFPAPES